MTRQNDGVAVRLGRYELHDELARGGMATLYLGRLHGDAGFARTVAIKRLHEQHAHDREFVAMFLDEARLAARIRHPNVVGTLDVVAQDGELFLVMEYVHGVALSTLIKLAGRGLPLAIAVAIMVDGLHALHAAHEAKDERGKPLDIVHRDISPQNILVGADGAARLLDFGIAKATGRWHASSNEGAIKGKLPYMAPEQVRASTVTRQTDIYACGAVLWELLTGRMLFPGTSQAQILEKVLFSTPRAPSTVEPEVPQNIDHLVMQALARQPAARFLDARTMAAALEDAVRPAQRSEVAAWVATLAGEVLEQRTQMIERIEQRGSRPSFGRVMSSLQASPVAPRATAAPLASNAALTEAIGQRARPWTETALIPQAAPRTSRRTRGLWIAASVVVIIGALGAVVFSGRSARVEVASRASSSTALPLRSSAPPSALPPASPPPPLSNGAPAVSPQTTASVRRAPTPRATARCEPYIDPQGIKRYKGVCQ